MSTNENMEIILATREKRAIYQKKLIKKYRKTLIGFKLNIPGPEKDSPLYRMIFNNGLNLLRFALDKNNIPIIFERLIIKITGSEAFLIVNEDAIDTKIICTEIEEKDGLGRIYDFDVIDSMGKAIGREKIGRTQRKCFLCDKHVWVCARNRSHNVEEMIQFIEKTAKKYFENDKI